jgi:hypothetical protein
MHRDAHRVGEELSETPDSLSIALDKAQTVWMTSPWPFVPYSPPPAAPGESIVDYRSRVAAEKLQAAERKRRELADQLSVGNAPAARIRAWETAYGLRLPRDGSHPILNVIASVARLSLDEVREEQRRRAAPP